MQDEIEKKIKALIEKYERVKSTSKLKPYKEEETKKDFILPLFEALGWDVYNTREVSAEETIISSGRVDYGFYLNDRIKFYVEAKKLSADIHDEGFARQAIRYSFNKGVTWAILTNFDTFVVFNAQNIEGKLHEKRFFEITHDQYLNRIDQLKLLSKKAFVDGLLDKEAERVGKKVQKVSVSTLLYKDLQKCRDVLTEALGQWNEKLSPDLLDEGVQKLLDRLIFIRVAEDRGIEPSTLIPLARQAREEEGGKLYQSMTKTFREFDGFYNSNLFSPHPFEQWEEYSFATEKVIRILYGKEGYYEYDFKAMPSDVLGTVYENYLSHRLSRSKKRITIASDAKKQKEQGIYYTPSYIVNYIIKNTLGPVLDRCKSIGDLKKIRVLDPACGSGSFLIKVLEAIFEKYKDLSFHGQEDLLKIQILAENIYGVDLDPQAVEITRLNLLINTLTKREKLPFLDNIKNGNSLVSGTEEELKKRFGKDFRDKKPFNWRDEFPEVFKQGGFDVIVGNPPYIKEYVNKSAFDGLRDNPYYQGKMDIWTLFACASIDLLKKQGLLSFIAPNNWITNAGASIFRNKILKEGELRSFVDFGNYKVFENAGIQTMVFVFEKGKSNKKYKVHYLKIEDEDINEDKLIAGIFGKKELIDIEPEKLIDHNVSFIKSGPGLILDKIQNKKNFELTDKEVGQGIVCPQEYVIDKHLAILKEAKVGDGIFVLKSDEVRKLNLDGKETELIKPFYTTEEISRYFSDKHNKLWVIYSNNEVNKNIDKYPRIKQHLQKYTPVITSDSGPFGLHRAREEKLFKGPSIFSIRKTDRPQFSYVDFPCYVSQTYFIVTTDRVDLKFLTGLLNSKLISFWLRNKGKLQGNLLQIDKAPLLEIPICVGDKIQRSRIITLVNTISELNKGIREIPENYNKWILIKSEIEKTDKKIDGEVYKLYSLTLEEIKAVEQENETK